MANFDSVENRWMPIKSKAMGERNAVSTNDPKKVVGWTIKLECKVAFLGDGYRVRRGKDINVEVIKQVKPRMTET